MSDQPEPFRGAITAVIRVDGYTTGIDDMAAGIRRHLADLNGRPDVREIRVSTRPALTWRNDAGVIAVTLAPFLGFLAALAGAVLMAEGPTPAGITLGAVGLALVVASVVGIVGWFRRAVRRDEADRLR